MNPRARQHPFTQHPALWLGMLLLAGVIIATFAQWALRHGVGWPCLFLNATGIPCPTCGATRAFAALASLDPLTALRINPLLTVGAFSALAAPFLWPRLQRAPASFWISVALLIALNWAYLCLFLPR